MKKEITIKDIHKKFLPKKKYTIDEISKLGGNGNGKTGDCCPPKKTKPKECEHYWQYHEKSEIRVCDRCGEVEDLPCHNPAPKECEHRWRTFGKCWDCGKEVGLPKSAPQSWEEEFEDFLERYDGFKNHESIINTVRVILKAEIEKARDRGYEEGARKQAEMDADLLAKLKEKE